MKRFSIIVFVILLLLWIRTAFYAADYAEFAYVTRFGDPVAILDGQTDAGLHIKLPWPIDTVQRVDRRLQTQELPATEALTRDLKTRKVDKTLTVDAFVTWRVPDAAAADRFIKTVGTPDQVKRYLGPRITTRLAAVISGMSLTQLIAAVDDAEAEARSERLAKMIDDDNGKSLREKVQAEYGIEIVSLRVRRLTYPEAVRTRIYERIRSEREVRVAEYDDQGRQLAADIISQAELDKSNIESKAVADQKTLAGEADREADRLRTDAYAKDPEFFAFLLNLRSMQKALSAGKDVLMLSLKHEFFRPLREPPAMTTPMSTSPGSPIPPRDGPSPIHK